MIMRSHNHNLIFFTFASEISHAKATQWRLSPRDNLLDKSPRDNLLDKLAQPESLYRLDNTRKSIPCLDRFRDVLHAHLAVGVHIVLKNVPVGIFEFGLELPPFTACARRTHEAVHTFDAFSSEVLEPHLLVAARCRELCLVQRTHGARRDVCHRSDGEKKRGSEILYNTYIQNCLGQNCYGLNI